MTWGRGYAMAGDAPGLDPTHAGFLTTTLGWLAGLATATVGAIGLWLAQRVLGKAAFQTAMNDGFAKLNDKLQVEMDRREKVIAAEHLAIAAERIAWSEERTALKGRIRQLEQTVGSLQRQLGLEPSLVIAAEPGATEI